MQKLLNDIGQILLAVGDWYIIWLVGPDGTIFDALSIMKIVFSAISLIIAIGKLLYRF